MFCKVSLIGRLTKDTEQSKKGVKASIAYTSAFRQDENSEYESNFIDAIFFGKNSENAQKILSKGDLVYIDGNLSYSSYNDKDGVARKYACVLVSSFRILTPKKNSGDNQSKKAELEDNNSQMPF